MTEIIIWFLGVSTLVAAFLAAYYASEAAAWHNAYEDAYRILRERAERMSNMGMRTATLERDLDDARDQIEALELNLHNQRQVSRDLEAMIEDPWQDCSPAVLAIHYSGKGGTYASDE